MAQQNSDIKYLTPIAVDLKEASALQGKLMMVQEQALKIPDNRIPGKIAKLPNAAARQSALQGYILVEIAAQAALGGLQELSNQRFKTLAGEIAFDSDGSAELTPFGVTILEGAKPEQQEAN